MLLYDLRTQFNKCINPCEGTFKLMQETFGFYNELVTDFLGYLGEGVQNDQLSAFMQSKLRPKFFQAEFCQRIEETKKKFLSEIIKLEEFLNANEDLNKQLIDLGQLKDVANSVYELLQSHWELYKYQKQAVDNKVMVSILLEIDRIGIGWDAFLEHYLAILRLLKETGEQPNRSGKSPIKLHYHLPQGSGLPLSLLSNLNQFLEIAYELVCKVHDKEEADEVEVMLLEGDSPMGMMLWVPSELAASFAKLLGYLSLDVIKRETLVKYVTEVVSAGVGSDLPKQQMTQYQKKLAKQLEILPEEGYFSINEEEAMDSVQMLTGLVKELEKMNGQYKDLLTGVTGRISRNRLSQQAAPESAQPVQESTPGAGQESASQPNRPASNQGSRPEEKDSTVKLDVKEKQHLGFLTGG